MDGDIADDDTTDDEVADEDAARAGAAIRLAVARIARRLRQTHGVGDVTLSEVSVLARLSRDGADSPGSLAELERVRPQAMATTLAALERAWSGTPCSGRRRRPARRS